MKGINGLKNRFMREGSFRLRVYGISLALNVVNVGLPSMMNVLPLNGLFKAVLTVLFLMTVAATLVTYYISGGIGGFAAVIIGVSKLAYALVGIMAALTAWMLGLGGIFAALMGIAAVACVAIGGLCFAYFLPAVFVPFLSFIGRHFLGAGVDETCGAEAACEAEDEVRWDRVFDNVMKETRTEE